MISQPHYQTIPSDLRVGNAATLAVFYQKRKFCSRCASPKPGLRRREPLCFTTIFLSKHLICCLSLGQMDWSGNGSARSLVLPFLLFSVWSVLFCVFYFSFPPFFLAFFFILVCLLLLCLGQLLYFILLSVAHDLEFFMLMSAVGLEFPVYALV